MTLPVPMIADEITCVVDKGLPRNVEIWITIEDVKSDAKPLIGSIFTILPETVLIIRHPPIDVPSPIAVAAAILTQIGTFKSV
ncbi:hypothetical protein D3C86_1861600 [compost metagenome]